MQIKEQTTIEFIKDDRDEYVLAGIIDDIQALYDSATYHSGSEICIADDETVICSTEELYTTLEVLRAIYALGNHTILKVGE